MISRRKHEIVLEQAAKQAKEKGCRAKEDIENEINHGGRRCIPRRLVALGHHVEAVRKPGDDDESGEQYENNQKGSHLTRRPRNAAFAKSSKAARHCYHNKREWDLTGGSEGNEERKGYIQPPQ